MQLSMLSLSPLFIVCFAIAVATPPPCDPQVTVQKIQEVQDFIQQLIDMEPGQITCVEVGQKKRDGSDNIGGESSHELFTSCHDK
jgi:hypothetical protein